MCKISCIIRVFKKKIDEKFKVTSVLFCTEDFNLWSCELDNFTLSLLY